MLVLRQWCSPASGAPQDPKLLQLTLKSLVGMVHILHASSHDQRKVEIRAILDSYFKVLNSDQPMASLEGSPGPHWEERLIALRVNMLGRWLSGGIAGGWSTTEFRDESSALTPSQVGESPSIQGPPVGSCSCLGAPSCTHVPNLKLCDMFCMYCEEHP